MCYLLEIIAACQKKEIYSMWLQRFKQDQSVNVTEWVSFNQHKRYKNDSCPVVKRLPPEVVIFSYMLSRIPYIALSAKNL